MSSSATRRRRHSFSRSVLTPLATSPVGARRDRRKTAPAEQGDGVAAGALSPSEDLASRELAGELVTAINKLSRSQAAAITLRIFDELPYEEIAAALGCSEPTARKHVERAKTQLRAVLLRHAPNHILRS